MGGGWVIHTMKRELIDIRRSDCEEISGLLAFDFDWLDHHELAHLSLIQKLDAARDLGEERVVFATADVETRLYRCAALANDNRAAGNQLSAECLEAKPLRVRIAAVS
jgi:hypothetical protein